MFLYFVFEAATLFLVVLIVWYLRATAMILPEEWEQVYLAVRNDVLTIHTINADQLAVLLEMAQTQIERNNAQILADAQRSAELYGAVEGGPEETATIFGVPTVIEGQQ